MKYQKLYEFANITSVTTGFDNIIIWVGQQPGYHFHRVKISNVPNKCSKDNFTITIPDLKIIGTPNRSLIDSKTLDKLKIYISTHSNAIIAYLNDEISYADFVEILKDNSTLDDTLNNI